MGDICIFLFRTPSESLFSQGKRLRGKSEVGKSVMHVRQDPGMNVFDINGDIQVLAAFTGVAW